MPVFDLRLVGLLTKPNGGDTAQAKRTLKLPGQARCPGAGRNHVVLVAAGDINTRLDAYFIHNWTQHKYNIGRFANARLDEHQYPATSPHEHPSIAFG